MTKSAAMFCCLGLVVALSVSAFGQDDDDEQPPGLRARYQVSDVTIERVDPDISFPWGAASPDPRLPSGPFKAQWSGTLLLRTAGKYQFHAFLQGKVSLKVNGQEVLQGQADAPRWIGGSETALTFGDQPFEVSYVRTGEAGQLQLYWSSEDFPLEPIPYHSLFQAKPSPELSLVERGRVQFEAHRCVHCHAGPDEGSRLDAPSLKHVGTGTSREWLIKKLMRNGGATPVEGEKMPHFGFDRNDAEAVVAALLSQATPADLGCIPKLKDVERLKDLHAGRALVLSVGCLACHSWDCQGGVTPYSGGYLDLVATRRSSDWLATWLKDPTQLNPRHRMPVFNLSDKERAQIVLALTSTGPQFSDVQAGDPSANDEIVVRGTKLIESARCANCHELSKIKPIAQPLPSLIEPTIRWDHGCTKPFDRSKNRPEFPQVDAAAIQAYVASWKPSTKPTSSDFMRGQHLLERKNCTNCHDRDDRRGISKHAATIAKGDEALSGLHMTLIPPRLNAVGDRMQDVALAEAIRGQQKIPRLNWLRVRMPKFAHTDSEQSALMYYLIGHDRIPDASPTRQELAIQIPEKADPQQILAGRELLGGKGFSCVACHAVKDYTPKVTALGTRGSNLHLIGQRMRSEYFFRWTRAPLRVMPGVEMPNYQRPHEFILPGQLNQQLIAIWQALNDPSLTAPTNPAVVEQLLTVGPTDHPRIVRDVFTVPGSPEETVARPYAAGLPGGHSILFDLDTCTVRGWALGDFARQRCEGKRWYWDLAGVTLAAGFDKRPDIFLLESKTSKLIDSETGWKVDCRLISELRHERSIELHYGMTCTKDDATFNLSDVVEHWKPTNDGWSRQITAPAVDGVEIWYRNVTPKVQFDHSKIQTDAVTSGRDPALPATSVPFVKDAGTDRQTVQVLYSTTLRWQPIASMETPPKLSSPDKITTVPGFEGRRLAFPRSIMPTAMGWDHRQRLFFTSLKGHLYRQESADDGQLSVVEEGLAAPYGVIEVPASTNGANKRDGYSLVVAHKPELLDLQLNDQGKVQRRRVLATGWGITDDYHDWTCGIVKDSTGSLFVGLGSDYTFKNRPAANSRWRGDILRVQSDGKVESIARGLRYPTGLAIDDQDRLFCSDQQGVQNTFNELNYIQVGHRYGVPSRHEATPDAPADPPAVQIPHPWTRSVNGIVWVPKSASKGLAPFAGQFLGCEFNNHSLIRMSIQAVGDVVQGAAYPFSKPAKEGDSSNFVAPLSIGISPAGDVYVGGLQDGGWAGGLNVGDIVRLTPHSQIPNGIREIRATKRGFEIEFFQQIDPQRATEKSHYRISGYTRVWKGDYATPDSGNHPCEVESATLNPEGRTVSLIVSGRRTGHVYDIAVGEVGVESQELWPAIAHYTLLRIPE